MAQLSARRVALAALRLWRKQKRFADSIISELLDNAALGRSDRAFAFDLFYGALRNLTLLDFWIQSLRPERIETQLRDVLRLGLYQLFLLNSAEHAAVHETVELAPRRLRPVANAVLRDATRRRSELIACADAQPLSVRTSHPEFLVKRWQQYFGDESAECLCKWNNLAAPIYARINRLKIDPHEFLRRYSTASSLGSSSEFVQFPALPIGAVKRGHCYIQDPSTTIACKLLDPQPGEKVLDACAAPGGKTCYVAQLMENCGTIVACDRDQQRLDILEKNMASLSVDIARSYQHDWTRGLVPDIASLAPFDRILLDAPCSNTGVMRRRVDVKWRLQSTDFTRMQQQQITILRALVPLLKTDGVLVYSTCSLEPEENETVVRRFVADLPILQLETEEFSLPFRDDFDGAYAAKLIRTR